MPTLKQFKLPDLGEGLTEGEIIRWLVAVGDTVTLNQPIVEVETAKAAVEVPSPFAGVVTELHHPEGATVDVGQPIISFDVDGGANPAESADAVTAAADRPAASETAPATLVEHPPTDAAVEPGLIGGPAPGGRTSVLVGYGPKSASAKRRPRRAEPSPAAPEPGPARPQPARVSAAAVGARAAATAGEVAVLAKPPVRKLARDLGVDLRQVPGTGPNGTVTRADVEAAAGPARAGTAPAGTAPADAHRGAAAAAPAGPAALEFDPVTGEHRIPIRGVRKSMAAAMVASAYTAPHVTEFLTVDVTRSMELLRRLKERDEFRDVRLTPLALVAKALLVSVARHPVINSSWDEQAQEIVVRRQVNLGIAAATPRGLVVPNIKDAGRLSLVALADAITDLVTTARDGRTAPADMQNGTITITNVGVFGVDTGTPILNPGEAAILCFGAVRPMPWVYEGDVAVRQVTQLSLSFDHRIVDGRLGSEVLADVGALLEDPATFLAW